MTLAEQIAARDAAWRARYGDTGESYLLDILTDRAARYAAHLATMTIEPDMIAWAMQMAAHYGPYVKVHHFIHDSWLTALLVLRYGEEPDSARSSDPDFTGWPLTFSAGDRGRALELLAGERWPESVTLLHREVTP